MRLNSTSGKSNGTRSGGGFVKEATVKAVEVQYDIQEDWMNRPCDIQIIVTYNSGQDWDNELKLFGNFNREKVNWGSALKIKMFFEAAGIKDPDDINNDWTIKESWLEEVINQKILVLDYPTTRTKDNGKAYWDTFKEVCHVDKGMDHLKEKFLKQVSGGWIKDYSTNDPATDFDFKSKKEDPSSYVELDL
jgi:hypothetical protein